MPDIKSPLESVNPRIVLTNRYMMAVYMDVWRNTSNHW